MGEERSRPRALVADDDACVVDLLATLLERAGFSVTRAADGELAVAAARTLRPRLAVVDVNLPLVCGWEVCRTLRAELGPAVAILVVSGERTEAHDRVAGLLLGADDYLAKPFSPDELVARARALVRRVSPSGASQAVLTPREREVLEHLAHGLDQRAIAALLVISPKTVGTHLERVLQKLGVHSRAQAVAAAYRDGLVAAPQ